MAGAAVTFSAPEYQADGSVLLSTYAFVGSAGDGWEIRRAGAAQLRLGPGYRLLRVSHCGVCSTDLARRYLPFPLPQIIGHEAVALEPDGTPTVIEINASHVARGLDRQQWCAFCRTGLSSHCPERLVLGIHGLPGGFSPWLVAPVANILPVPATISPLTATLIEPFAAALHAVHTLNPRDGDRVAVLGPRRLGLLLIAALAAWRRQAERRFEIVAIARRVEMRALAATLGADEVLDANAAPTLRDMADIVIDTTGNPAGLALATQLATREVHVKSTTGQPALGLTHVTELVVDELAIAPYRDAHLAPDAWSSPPPQVATLLGDVPATVTRALAARGLRMVPGMNAADLARTLALEPLGGADLAVVTSRDGVDAAIRPVADLERGLVRARGTILIADIGQPRDVLLDAVLDKGLRVSTTRCGDFRAAIDLLAEPANHLGHRLGELMVTHRFPAGELSAALAAAAQPHSVKVIVTHPDALV